MMNSTHGIVLGGGLAGVLAARSLRDYVDRVSIVERDYYPDGPVPRRGVPQASHAHILWSGGAQVIERMLPGTMDRLQRAGARRVAVKRDMVLFTAYGWQHRFPASHFAITCSRPLLDWIVRSEVLRDPRVTALEGTEVLWLRGDAGSVTGARVQPRGGDPLDLAGDVVIDAMGRGSRLKHWLVSLGVPPVEEETVDTGLTYATRLFKAPSAAAEEFPVVSVYADHRAGTPGRNGLVLPIENGQWIVTLSGTRGAEPCADEEKFASFAESLRHRIVADVIAVGEPLSPVRITRSTINRRLLLDRMPGWPEGLVAVGDSVASLNPIHGHGMSVAAQCAGAIEVQLGRTGLTPGFARAAQQAVGAVVDTPWLLSTSQDICYPHAESRVIDPRLTAQAARRQWFADLVAAKALLDPEVSDAMTGVTTLTRPVSSLETPQFLAALQRADPRPSLTQAPLTADEALILPGYAPCVAV